MEWRENGIFKKDRKNFNKSIYFVFTYNWNFNSIKLYWFNKYLKTIDNTLNISA